MNRQLATLILCAGLAAMPALAQQKLLEAQSEIAFVTRQMGVPVQGRFRVFDGQIDFDPKKPQAGRIAFSVATGSATLGVAEADEELHKPLWFNVPGFPRATFLSQSIKPLGGGRFEVTGVLTIKGRQQSVVVPVQLSQSGAITTATGVFALKRLVFGVGEAQWADTTMVADEVQVRFKFALNGVGKF
ncbi:MAG: YceI family protein [Hydrogenophaga sp.]|uniref:YceI family protein n=1 Tax=Hydrogenophaga sp. TaxID=1904254 RepID=UPI002ABCC529|nr:YceI family protein [Hydrogenophaga sp.]MDZ4187587.1 YceI family protein [Hydrogenophaga sp.]